MTDINFILILLTVILPIYWIYEILKMRNKHKRMDGLMGHLNTVMEEGKEQVKKLRIAAADDAIPWFIERAAKDDIIDNASAIALKAYQKREY